MATASHFLNEIKINFSKNKKIELAIEWETHEPKCGVHKMVTLLGIIKRVKLELRMKKMWHLIGRSVDAYLLIVH